MKIDYICYCVPEVGKTFYEISPNDNENVKWIKRTDLAQMQKAQKYGILVVYSLADQQFYKDGKPFDVSGKTILPKSVLFHELDLLKALDNTGAKSLNPLKDRLKVTKWPKYFQPMHRKAFITTYGEFKKNHKKYKEILGTVFLKTPEKSSQHYFLKFFGEFELEKGQKLFFTKPPIFDIKDEDEIYLSKQYGQIEDKENDMNCKEYRAFVVDGKILSLSRSYVDYSTKISDEVMDFAKRFVNCVSNTNFPKNYVIDFGEMLVDGKKVIDVVECNSISASGLEVDHDIVEAVMQRNKETEK